MSRETSFQYQGQIDLEKFTTTAYFPAKDGVIVASNNFKESGQIMLQMGSADLSGAVTCSFEVSVDGTYWDVAQEADVDITFSLSASTPVVRLITGAHKLMWRVSIAIASQTGVVDYIIKDVV